MCRFVTANVTKRGWLSGLRRRTIGAVKNVRGLNTLMRTVAGSKPAWGLVCDAKTSVTLVVKFENVASFAVSVEVFVSLPLR